MISKIIIGSRGSDLALWQANLVKAQLAEIEIDSEIKIIKTKGDKIQDLSFDKIEGKGFFTKEIEDALLNKEIDLAVHSHKDLETELPSGLVIAAVSDRADPADILLIRKESVNEKQRFSIKKGATIGTSSARRKSLTLLFRPDIKLKDLRGNVPTRIEKLRKGEYDGILLASAGVNRLEINLNEFYVERLEPKEFIPAPAQGVLALQIRESDCELHEKLQNLNNDVVKRTISVERMILNRFQGGCQLPLGAYCELSDDDETFCVWLAVAKKADSLPLCIYAEGRVEDTLVEKVLSKVMNIKPTSVFITRNLYEGDLFEPILSGAGYTVIGKPLIEIKQIPFKTVPKTDWIFFSSKNAVYHFFAQNPDVEGVKYGVIGKSTADALRKHGKRADFIGASTNTQLIGKQFYAMTGKGSVLFPQSKRSIKTVQHQMMKSVDVTNLFVYESVENSTDDLPEAEVLVFTSPSNAQSYLRKHKIKPTQKVVAMGHATASELKKYGIHHPKMPDSFDGLGLARAVMSL